MRLKQTGEGRVTPIRSVDAFAEEYQQSPYEELLGLLEPLKVEIARDFNSGLWFVRCINAYYVAKLLDPTFTVPEIDSIACKEKLFEHFSQYEKIISEKTLEGKMDAVKDCEFWIVQSASKVGVIFPELKQEIIERIQPHVEVLLNQSEEDMTPTQLSSSETSPKFLALLSLGGQIAEQARIIAKKNEESIITFLKELAQKEPLTEDEELELLFNLVLFRLVYPARQAEIQALTPAKILFPAESGSSTQDKFFVKFFSLLARSAQVKLLPSGLVEFTPPAGSVTPTPPLPSRSNM